MTAGSRSQKEMNEDFFARKGGENERRREDLPPSQGGKYAGFGSSQPAAAIAASGEEGMPGVDEFQKDPVAALTKGFGWFTTTVGKGAKSVNDGWVKPNVQKLAEADLATQARLTAAQVAQNIQAGSKNAAEHFNRFVEDSTSPPPPYSSSHTSSPLTSRHPRSKAAATEPEHKDFWDSFGSPVVAAAVSEEQWDDDEWQGQQSCETATAATGEGKSGAAVGADGEGRWWECDWDCGDEEGGGQGEGGG
ncbi:MAG: hypothetical protein L6R35_005767 [Caloplaca aegaea]|nr:MAG: hypothetical protein L6R35_005767 [Caloplaca aegaea]